MACVIRGIYDTEKKEGDFLPYVPVPKDLTKVKTKVAFNLTKRQLVFFSIAGAVGSAGKAPAGKHPAGAKKPVRSKKGR